MTTSPRRSRTSARSASAAVAVLAFGGVLVSCGDDDRTATDPATTTSTPTPTEAPTEAPTEEPTEAPTGEPTGEPTEEPSAGGGASPIRVTGSAGVTDAVVVDATEGGGSPSTMAFALDTDQAVADFGSGLQAGLPEEVAAAVEQVAGRSSGATPYGAVVSTGCEPPRSVAIDAGEAGFQVVPRLPKDTVQCFAPVTYVVVFAAPDA